MSAALYVTCTNLGNDQYSKTHTRMHTYKNRNTDQFSFLPVAPPPPVMHLFSKCFCSDGWLSPFCRIFSISPFWCHVKKNDEKKMSIHTHKSSTMPCKCRNTNTIVNTLFAFIFFICVACVPFNFVVGRSLQRFCHHSSSSSAFWLFKSRGEIIFQINH